MRERLGRPETRGEAGGPTRVVVLGGGFAGLSVVRALEGMLPAESGVEITLVNRDNFTLFTPMLHEVAASDLDLTHVVNPLRKLVRRARLFVGTVEGVDLERRRVILSHGGDHHHHELAYDHLVLALGAITNFYDVPGVAGNALTMKTLGDAILLRNRLLEQLEEADNECASDERRALLTFVVAGGGFAGVETIAAVNDFVREALPHYPRLSEADVRLVLVHAGARILPELGPRLGIYAERKLRGRGVEIRLGTQVRGCSRDAVTLSDGSQIAAHTLVWTAGTSPNPMLHALPCARERGRVAVDRTLEVPGWPGVWAVGDCAAIRDRAGELYPPTAQHAVRQGRVLAHNIVASLRGRPKRPFDFTALGQLAAIGRRTGVANLFGINFSGFVAWWLWRTIYLAKLPRLEKKLRVALDWTLDLIFSKDLVQYGTGRAPSISEVDHETEPALKAGEPYTDAALRLPNGVPASSLS